MVELFKAFLLTSLIGTALTIILILIKPLTRKYFSGSWHYYMWLTVLLIMIMPIKLNLPQISAKTQSEKIVNTPLKKLEETENPLAVDTPLTAETKLQPEKVLLVKKADTYIDIFSYIWAGGIIVLLLFRFLSYMIFLIKVNKDTEVTECPTVFQYTKRKIKIRESEKVSSPLVIGIFKPTLILPKMVLTEEQLHNILSHEMTHLNRNDLLYKWFASFVKCVHWFNPTVYFIDRQINIDCEISCDELVTKTMNDGEKRNYIETILFLLTHNKSKSVPLTTGMANNKKILKRRFTMIKNNMNRKNRILSTALAVVLLLTSLLTSGVLATGIEGENDIVLKDNSNIIELSNKPFLENGTVYIPLRELFEKADLTEYIKWDNGKIEFCLIEYDGAGEETKKLHYFYGVEIGESEYTLNPEGTLPENRKHLSQTKKMNNAPILKNNITYIPYEYLDDMVNLNMVKRERISLEYKKSYITSPVQSTEITREFGTKVHPITGVSTTHNGIDISAPKDTEVVASIQGKVTEIGFDNEMGNYIVISNDNGLSVMYGHLEEMKVSKEDYVLKNTIVGTVGQTGMATGTFLHFEIRINGDCFNPMIFCNPTETVSVLESSIFNEEKKNIKPIEIVEDNTKPHSVIDSFFRRFETKDYSGMKTFCKESLWNTYYKEGPDFGGIERARLDELLEPEYINDNYISYEVKISSKKVTGTNLGYYSEINTWKLYVEKQPDGTYLIADIKL